VAVLADWVLRSCENTRQSAAACSYGSRIEMIHQPALPRDVELAVGRLHHHLAGLLPSRNSLSAADEIS